MAYSWVVYGIICAVNVKPVQCVACWALSLDKISSLHDNYGIACVPFK